MSRSSVSGSAALLVAAVAAFSLAGCASSKSKEPFVRADVTTVAVDIAAVDPATRMLLLRGPAGYSSVVAGPEVRNFDQIKVGDKVEVSYVSALAAEISKSKAAPGPAQDSTETYTAPAGDKPAAGISQTLKTTVTIESVDTSADTVTFKRPDGFVRVVDVETDEGRTFIRTLRPGDKVDLTYTEAVAVAVVPGS